LAEGRTTMETDVKVAIIAGIATVAAAVFKRKPPSSEPKPTISIGGNVSGAIVATGDVHDVTVYQQIVEDRIFSKDGSRLIIETSKEIITDESLRRRWSSFDAKFLHECIKNTPRGFALDGEAAKRFARPDADELMSLGVQVYRACFGKIADETNSDYQAFNRIAQVYLSLRIAAKSQTS
jgi:hypothetical protein